MRIRRLAALLVLALTLMACAGDGGTGGPDGTGPEGLGSSPEAVGGSPDAARAPSDLPPDGSTGPDGSPDAGGPPGDGSAGGASADVLAWTAPTLDGGRLDGAEYAGRDVVLWMWAPW